MTIYSSGSIPLPNERLAPPPRGRGVNCALRVVVRELLAVVAPSGRAGVGKADTKTTFDDPDRDEGNGGRELLALPSFDFLLSSPSGVRGQSTSNMPLMMFCRFDGDYCQ